VSSSTRIDLGAPARKQVGIEYKIVPFIFNGSYWPIADAGAEGELVRFKD
jgi:hypothetical protein